MKKILFVIICASLFMSACEPTAEPRIIIIPKQCKLNPGEQLPLSLESSNKPEDSEITWSASDGTLSSTNDLSVVYTAPDNPGTVIITAKLDADGKQFSTTLTCEVAGMQIVTDVPVVSTPATEVPVVPTLDPRPVGDTIAITEVMAYPCGASDQRPSINEYIELYNYGAADVDVQNWWIGTTGGGEGTPDKLVPWTAVNPTVSLGNNVKGNTAVIPPGGFAIVISPEYHKSLGKYKMPYAFASGTIILTFPTSDYLGNDSRGLVSADYPLTTIVLYKGTDSIISSVISTYGTPSYGSSPSNIVDNKQDNFPYFMSECHAMERIDPSAKDALSNWHDINPGTPGWGDYKK